MALPTSLLAVAMQSSLSTPSPKVLQSLSTQQGNHASQLLSLFTKMYNCHLHLSCCSSQTTPSPTDKVDQQVDTAPDKLPPHCHVPGVSNAQSVSMNPGKTRETLPALSRHLQTHSRRHSATTAGHAETTTSNLTCHSCPPSQNYTTFTLQSCAPQQPCNPAFVSSSQELNAVSGQQPHLRQPQHQFRRPAQLRASNPLATHSSKAFSTTASMPPVNDNHLQQHTSATALPGTHTLCWLTQHRGACAYKPNLMHSKNSTCSSTACCTQALNIHSATCSTLPQHGLPTQGSNSSSPPVLSALLRQWKQTNGTIMPQAGFSSNAYSTNLRQYISAACLHPRITMLAQPTLSAATLAHRYVFLAHDSNGSNPGLNWACAVVTRGRKEWTARRRARNARLRRPTMIPQEINPKVEEMVQILKKEAGMGTDIAWNCYHYIYTKRPLQQMTTTPLDGDNVRLWITVIKASGADPAKCLAKSSILLEFQMSEKRATRIQKMFSKLESKLGFTREEFGDMANRHGTLFLSHPSRVGELVKLFPGWPIDDIKKMVFLKPHLLDKEPDKLKENLETLQHLCGVLGLDWEQCVKKAPRVLLVHFGVIAEYARPSVLKHELGDAADEIMGGKMVVM